MGGYIQWFVGGSVSYRFAFCKWIFIDHVSADKKHNTTDWQAGLVAFCCVVALLFRLNWILYLFTLDTSGVVVWACDKSWITFYVTQVQQYRITVCACCGSIYGFFGALTDKDWIIDSANYDLNKYQMSVIGKDMKFECIFMHLFDCVNPPPLLVEW